MKDTFFRVKKLGRLKSTDQHEAYQIEVVEMDGEKVVRRFWFRNPDTKQQTLAWAELMNDPDSDFDKEEELPGVKQKAKNEKQPLSA